MNMSCFFLFSLTFGMCWTARPIMGPSCPCNGLLASTSLIPIFISQKELLLSITFLSFARLRRCYKNLEDHIAAVPLDSIPCF